MDGSATRLTAQPLHVQLRRALMKRIAAGEWRHGELIPNENDLAREFNLSPGTVRKALDWMEQARLVIRQQGRGTFVTDPASPDLAQRFDTIFSSDGTKLKLVPADTAIQTSAATPDEANRLQLSSATMVLRVRQIRRFAHGPVAMVEEAVLPARLFAALTEASMDGYDIMRASKHCMVLLGEGIENTSLATPPEHVAALFGLMDAGKVLLLDRIIHTVEGVPAELRRAWCHLGDNVYRSRLA